MSDMEETEGTPELPEGSGAPAAPHRVIGTPPPSPRLLGRGDGDGEAADQAPGGGGVAVAEHAVEKLPTEPDYPEHAKNAEKIVVALFLLAFVAGCGFIAAYIGLGVHTVDKVFRSNLALGLSLSVTLLALGTGALIWVRHIMPDAEVVEERHPMRSSDADREAFAEYFAEATGASQFVKRPIVRRTLMLATLPLAAIPIVVLRDLGPLP